MNAMRRRLLAALLGALLAAGLVSAFAIFLSARAEVDRLLDEELQQVALSLRDHARLDLARLERGSDDPDLRVLVQIWDPAFERPYTSRLVSPLPRQSVEGYATLQHEGRAWRVFTTRSSRQTIEVAQPTLLRTELAARTALRVLWPVLVMLPVLGLVGWWIVGRGLAPLAALATTLEQRSPQSLEPVALVHAPDELQPLVYALNDLLRRLRFAFDSQRRFAADAAHELRSPLAALNLQVQLAQRADSPEERAIALEQLAQGVKRATRLVEQLLTMARLDPEASAATPTRVDLATVAKAVANDRRPLAADRGIELTIDAQAAPVLGQEDALQVLVANLVDNGLRYTPSGGMVHICVRGGEQVTLEVSDTGPGIPADERARVFDRFYRGRNAPAGGSGLGLAIVAQVAQLHGAAIELGERPGGGLVVRAQLPGCNEPPSSALRAA